MLHILSTVLLLPDKSAQRSSRNHELAVNTLILLYSFMRDSGSQLMKKKKPKGKTSFSNTSRTGSRISNMEFILSCQLLQIACEWWDFSWGCTLTKTQRAPALLGVLIKHGGKSPLPIVYLLVKQTGKQHCLIKNQDSFLHHPLTKYQEVWKEEGTERAQQLSSLLLQHLT